MILAVGAVVKLGSWKLIGTPCWETSEETTGLGITGLKIMANASREKSQALVHGAFPDYELSVFKPPLSVLSRPTW